MLAVACEMVPGNIMHAGINEACPATAKCALRDMQMCTETTLIKWVNCQFANKRPRFLANSYNRHITGVIQGADIYYVEIINLLLILINLA